jgi:hypothetical protein
VVAIEDKEGEGEVEGEVEGRTEKEVGNDPVPMALGLAVEKMRVAVGTKECVPPSPPPPDSVMEGEVEGVDQNEPVEPLDPEPKGLVDPPEGGERVGTRVLL